MASFPSLFSAGREGRRTGINPARTVHEVLLYLQARLLRLRVEEIENLAGTPRR